MERWQTQATQCAAAAVDYDDDGDRTAD